MREIISAVFFCLLLISLTAQTNWKTDLQYLKTELPKRHKDLFFNISEEEFNARLDQLIEESPYLSDMAIGVKMQQLFADIGDSHTTFSLGKLIDPEKTLPIQAYWFDDGVYITRTSESHKKTNGSKILKVNDYPIQSVIDSLSTLLVQDNPSVNKAYLLNALGIAEILEIFGFVDTQKDIVFELENKNGLFEEILHTGENEKMDTPLPIEKRGIGYENQRYFFWDRYFAEDSIYYVQYNRCWSRELEKKHGDKRKVKEMPSFKDFSKRVFNTIDRKPVKKFIFDIRHNGGGSSLQGTRFIRRLKTYQYINKKGHLFVIVGRSTFSSAIINTMNFKNETEAVIIGEETAGGPDHYGEVKSFRLPSSGITVRYSTKYFDFTGKNMKSIKPDVVVPVNFSDFIMGKDAAFETARGY